MKGQKQVFSSTYQNWETPKPLFNRLHERFNFTIDLAASPDNHLLPRFYTEEDNSLIQSWVDERGFTNPPYNIAPEFIEKSYMEVAYGCMELNLLLVPARTSNKEWEEFVFPHAEELIFINGRVKFGNSPTGAPFPSVCILFREDNCGKGPKVSWISVRGE
jgi:site-specific DNA-methyltransferase (adenine-specific)